MHDQLKTGQTRNQFFTLLKEFNDKKTVPLKKAYADEHDELFDSAKIMLLEAQASEKLDLEKGLTFKALELLKIKNLEAYFSVHKNDENLAKAKKSVEKLKKELEKEYANSKSTYSNVMPALKMPGHESYGDRIAHLAKFSPESMAMMALFDDLYFLGDLAACLFSLKLMITAMPEWENYKNDAHFNKFTFDPADFKYHDKASKNKSEKALLNRDLPIYRYKIVNNSHVRLLFDEGPITDSREIDLETCLANGIMCKPTNVGLARQACIKFTLGVAGMAIDPLYTIESSLRSNQGGPGNSQSQYYEDQNAAAVAMAPRP